MNYKFRTDIKEAVVNCTMVTLIFHHETGEPEENHGTVNSFRTCPNTFVIAHYHSTLLFQVV